MRQFLNGDTLYNNIRMLLAARTTPLLVVEGESDNTLFEEKLGSSIPFALVTSYGKPVSIAAANRSVDDQVDRVLFLIDADFDRLTGTADLYPASHILTTVHYDLLCDVIMSSSRPVLSVIRAFSKAGEAELTPDAILAIAMKLAAMVGLFRYASNVNNWQVDLERFPMHDLIPEPNAPVDFENVARQVEQRAKSSPIPLPSDFEDQTLEYADSVSETRLINSHDLLNAVAHCCVRYGKGKVRTKIEPTIILAIDSAEFEALDCVRATIDWAAQFSAA
jgi:hypothetical protein